MGTKAKYRPPLTASEVKVLDVILKRAYITNLSAPPYHPDFPTDPSRGFDKVHEDYCLQLMNKFSALRAKIDHGVANPAYTSNATTRSENQLLELGGEIEIPLTQGAGSSQLAPGERRALAYDKYLLEPISCTAAEIADALEHKFNYGLMSAEEAASYEAKVWENL